MNLIVKRFFCIGLLIFVVFMSGCAEMIEVAVTGVGKTAKIEPINFFKRSDDFMTKSGTDNLPDFYYISKNVDWSKYKKIIINDFTSLTPDIQKISGLQVTEFKNLRKDIPDNIVNAFDGSVFSQCKRSAERIDHNDINSIRNAQADAILFGNISEIIHMNLTAIQVEIKLVDTKTGEEIIKMINRSTSDSDRVSMPINRCLANLINKAKNSRI